MKAVPSLLFTLFVQMSAGLSIPIKKSDLLERNTESTSDYTKIDCISMVSNSGSYVHVSEGSMQVCGMYIISDPETIIEMQFSHFDVDCEQGLVGLVDGWELQSEFFPNIDDTGDTFADRYKTFCGINEPAGIYVASQNAALIQFKIPQARQGFRVRISFLPNPQPCNIMSLVGNGVVTLKNYGARRNCTVNFIYPENILLLSSDIGVTSTTGQNMDAETGLTVQCGNERGGDYVELLFGNGLDSGYMGRKMAFCGQRSKSARKHVTLGCSNTAVRLVSSGMYYNSITLSVSKPSSDQIEAFSPHCYLV